MTCGCLWKLFLLGLVCLGPRARSDATVVAGRSFNRRHHALRNWPTFSALPETTAAVTSVAVINPFPWCYEVLFGLVYSLQFVAQVVDVYVDFPDIFAETGAADFMKGFHLAHVRESARFWENYTSYEVVIWTDHFGWDLEDRRKEGPRDLLDLGFKGSIWLFNHEPEVVFWPMVCDCEEGRRWIEDKDYQIKTMQVFGHRQVEWFCIAPHVAAKVQALLDQIGFAKKVHWVLPVFPWSNQSETHVSRLSLPLELKKGFSIQGALDSHRRNYSGLLQDVAKSPKLREDQRFELDVFAWKELDDDVVPPSIKTKVVHKALKFPEFYQEIHKTLGLMLLFPGDRYYVTASSSSIATAISAGVPMIVEKRFLEVYSFIPHGAVVIANSGNHATAMEQMLALTAADYKELTNMADNVAWQLSVVRL